LALFTNKLHEFSEWMRTNAEAPKDLHVLIQFRVTGRKPGAVPIDGSKKRAAWQPPFLRIQEMKWITS